MCDAGETTSITHSPICLTQILHLNQRSARANTQAERFLFQGGTMLRLDQLPDAGRRPDNR